MTRKGAVFMCSSRALDEILERLCGELRGLLGESMREVILFGSYARGTAYDDSDIDVVILSDMDRKDLFALHFDIGKIAGDIFLDYGVQVSPIVENREFFQEYKEAMPFYRNVNNEGMYINAGHL